MTIYECVSRHLSFTQELVKEKFVPCARKSNLQNRKSYLVNRT
jgi:hypothetical protein